MIKYIFILVTILYIFSCNKNLIQTDSFTNSISLTKPNSKDSLYNYYISKRDDINGDNHISMSELGLVLKKIRPYTHLYLTGRYKFFVENKNKTITIDKPVSIIGSKHIKFIKKNGAINVLFDIKSNDVTFSNITFNGHRKLLAKKYLIRVLKGNNVAFNSCTFKNFINYKNKNISSQYILKVNLSNLDKFLIDSCTFENVQQFDATLDSKGVGNGPGFCGAILLYQHYDSLNTNPSSIIISNSHFSNIKTIKYGMPDSSVLFTQSPDADAIRFVVDKKYDSIGTNATIKIVNNSFDNIQKSAVKVAGKHKRVDISNNIVTNHGNQLVKTISPMIASFRTLQSAENVFIEDNKVFGNVVNGLMLQGKNIFVDNFIYIPSEEFGYHGISIGTQFHNIKSSNISISNFTISNVRQGIKVYSVKQLFITKGSISLIDNFDNFFPEYYNLIRKNPENIQIAGILAPRRFQFIQNQQHISNIIFLTNKFIQHGGIMNFNINNCRILVKGKLIPLH